MKDWKHHWENMPEFVQEDKTPYKVVKVKLATKRDYEQFLLVINQKGTEKTKSFWFPELRYEKPGKFIYDSE